MPLRRRYSRRPRRVSRARRSLKSRTSRPRRTALTRRVSNIEKKVGRKLTLFVTPISPFRVDGDTSANAVYIKKLTDYTTWVALFPGNTTIDDDVYTMYHRSTVVKGNLRVTPDASALISKTINIICHMFLISPRLNWDGNTLTQGLHYRAVDENSIVYMNLKYFKVHSYKKIMLNGYEPAYRQPKFKLKCGSLGTVYSPDQPIRTLTSSGDPKDNLYMVVVSNIVGGTSSERTDMDCSMEALHKVYCQYAGVGYT